ncbi:MAG: hypothetical protein AAFY81_07035 [Pseudomonadota bacterium]
MKRQLALMPLIAVSLSGCSLLFPEDKRLGLEPEDECVGRVRTSLTYQQSEALRAASGQWVPSFTYDVTKLDFEAIKELMVPGSDQTAGTRLMQQTNRTNAAVERFMAMDVSEKGAFFMGRDPALYRVRGKPQAASGILASGCARQRKDMRLIAVTWTRFRPPSARDADDRTDKTSSSPSDPSSET